MIDRMKRRSFLTGLAAMGVTSGLDARARIVSAVESAGSGRQGDLKITKIEILQITGKNKRKVLYLKIHTDGGPAGLYGPIDNEAAMFIDQFFKQDLIGQDP